ncbi:hypothetical protein KSP35_15455 [Aquihabitans sp. G128]|uniref:hypothetical protein n=1 Tax=Aquihabitans sp. G128 TaxID=2849779 RepID=UPI001C217784|nr:hypothetical protein [Aquihabitans sp. G128]QXC59768.1 hypothetical protein KSP35_15455 [Aquihabitans sp. G128]
MDLSPLLLGLGTAIGLLGLVVLLFAGIVVSVTDVSGLDLVEGGRRRRTGASPTAGTPGAAAAAGTARLHGSLR